MRTQTEGNTGSVAGSEKRSSGIGEFSLPRINSMTPAMLLIMLSIASCGVYLGYHITHNLIASLVFGGVFGRVGMWVGMISCSLVGGLEEYLQNIFS